MQMKINKEKQIKNNFHIYKIFEIDNRILKTNQINYLYFNKTIRKNTEILYNKIFYTNKDV